MRKNSGFSLIELIVVIAILGILALIAIPRFVNERAFANESAVLANLKNVRLATELYSADNNILISSINDDGSLLASVHGDWPTGPGNITYNVINGVSTANIDWSLPYPSPGITAYNGIVFIEVEKP